VAIKQGIPKLWPQLPLSTLVRFGGCNPKPSVTPIQAGTTKLCPQLPLVTLVRFCCAALFCSCAGIIVVGVVVWAVLATRAKLLDKPTSWFVAVPQLISLVQQHNQQHSTKTIQNALYQVPSQDKRPATKSELAWLINKEAVQAEAGRVTLVRVSAAVKVLSKLNVPGHVLSALAAVKAGTLLPSAPQQH